MNLGMVVTLNVRILMLTRGVKLNRDLAKALGWSEPKMSRVLNGNRWKINDLPKLARVLGVDVIYLVTPPTISEEYL